MSLGVLSACGVSSPTASHGTSATPVSPSAPTFPAVPQPAPLQWGACPPDVSQPLLQCAALKVPLDYSHPTGTQITLELSRMVHTSSARDYLGPILVNPGGPGGRGLLLATLGSRVPNNVGGQFDWIGWDPRGVGDSRPLVRCIPDYFGTDRPPYAASSARAFWLSRAKSFSAACARNTGALLDHITSEDNARDMDVIRQALGQSKISYYGFSWGSYLGQVYVSLFPSHVRRIVLDGVVDPRGVWYQANLDQDVAFERTIKAFFAWVASNNSVYHLGTTEAAVYAAYQREAQRLATQPAAGGKVGPDELGDVILNAGYFVYNWARNASDLSSLINGGDGSAVLTDYEQNNADPDSETGYAVYDAVQCTDVRWPGWSKTLADAERLSRTAPFETWDNTWFNAPCLTWPAAPHTPVTIHSTSGLPQILLIAETYDAATPFEGALEARSLFPSASLIEGVNGTTHAGSLNGVSCTDDAIATYLATGRTPTRTSGSGADLRCPPVPPPPASIQ